MKVAYFGCWGPAGHFLYGSGMSKSWNGVGPWKWDELDGKYPPNADQKQYVREEPQSVCRLVHERGWTVLAFWDRTGDKRGNSNSAFLAEGEHDFETMLGIARLHFPDLVKRIELAAPLTLAP